MRVRLLLLFVVWISASPCLTMRGGADVTEALRLPNLEVKVPPDILNTHGKGYGPWVAGGPEIDKALALGRSLAAERVPHWRVLQPWRVIVDKDGEYATLLSPPAVACLLAYYAEQREWPSEELQQKLADALDRFGKGVCIYVELRSYAHLGSSILGMRAGDIRPGTPAEAYEALFLLDAGGKKIEGKTSELPGGCQVNSNGLHYEAVALPEVSHTRPLSRVHSSGSSYGANYYLWWPLSKPDGTPTFGDDPERLRLTIITPARQREFSVELKRPQLR